MIEPQRVDQKQVDRENHAHTVAAAIARSGKIAQIHADGTVTAHEKPETKE